MWEVRTGGAALHIDSGINSPKVGVGDSPYCLGQVRHRAKVVEYRVEQHRAVLKDRLAALRAFGTTTGTTQQPSAAPPR